MKYHNKKTVVDGITFDSAKEAKRYIELSRLERLGAISGLKMQVPYELLPQQKNALKRVVRGVKYIADFVYQQDGQTIVEDVKGVKTREFILKQKMMLYFHGIEVKIV